jgi:hypothetical protein
MFGLNTYHFAINEIIADFFGNYQNCMLWHYFVSKQIVDGFILQFV